MRREGSGAMAAPRNEHSYATIDRNGVITGINESWRAVAKATGLTLPRFGVGASYLSHCSDDEQRRAIRSVARGEPTWSRSFIPVTRHNKKDGL